MKTSSLKISVGFSNYLVFFAFFLIVGCSSNSNSADDELKINGTWQGISKDTPDYLYIDMPNLEGYVNQDGCYKLRTRTLEHLSGDNYEAKSKDGTKYTASFRVEGDRLYTEENNKKYTFRESNADVTTFDICN